MRLFHDISYPSCDEVENIKNAFPAIQILRIRQDPKREERHESLETLEQSFEISSWIKLLSHRMREIQFTYYVLRHHFNYGIPDTQWKEDRPDGHTVLFPQFKDYNTKMHKFLFDYYAEYFFYQFFSAWDIIYKYLNCHYHLQVKENFKNSFNKKVESLLKVSDPELDTIMSSLFQQFTGNIEMRNNMAHDFPPHKVDDRPIESFEQGRRQVALGEYIYRTSAEVLKDVEFLVTALSSLIPKLQERIDQLFQVEDTGI